MTILKVKVQPGANKNEIVGMWLDMLKIKVTAQPESGKANKACVELLAKELDIPKTRFKIIKGYISREKLLEINDLPEDKLFGKLKKLFE